MAARGGFTALKASTLPDAPQELQDIIAQLLAAHGGKVTIGTLLDEYRANIG